MYNSGSVFRGTLLIGFLLLVVLMGTLFSPNGRAHAAVNPSLSGNWPMLGYNAAGTRYNPNENIINTGNVGSLVQRWSFTTFAQGVVGSSPAVVNGIVYIGATDHDFVPGEVDALSAKTGALAWKYTTVASVDASPAVINGVVYIGTEDGTFYAFNATSGAVIWQTLLGGGVHNGVTVVNGVIYVGSVDKKLYALSATTGNVIWSYTTGGEIHSTPAVVNGVVYISSNDGNIYALNAKKKGKVIWSVPFWGGGFSYSSPAVSGSIVYMWGMCGCASGRLYALEANTGSEVWHWDTSWLGAGVAVANGVIYLQSQGTLNALNASTGNLLWSTAGNWTNSSPTVANGVVYFDTGGILVAADASTGHVLWSSPWVNAIPDSPAVANGSLYFGDWGGNVYAFHLPK